MSSSESCPDCPIGGRDGSGPVCPHVAACDRQCAELVEAHGVRCGLRRDLMEAEHEACQTLGAALGYPHDPGPDGEPDPSAGICVGDHVAASLAMEAADRIRGLKLSRG